MTEPKVSEKEMLDWIRDLSLRYYSIQLTHPHLVTPPNEQDKAIYEAIRRRIEGPKVDEAFVRGWAESISGDPTISDIRRSTGKVKSLLRQAGVEVGKVIDG